MVLQDRLASRIIGRLTGGRPQRNERFTAPSSLESAQVVRLVPVFDIFAGIADRDAQWVETVVGLGNAVDRMREIAKDRPGRYFIFDPTTHRIVSMVEVVAEPQTRTKTVRNAS
jgi:hypothetical protein